MMPRDKLSLKRLVFGRAFVRKLAATLLQSFLVVVLWPAAGGYHEVLTVARGGWPKAVKELLKPLHVPLPSLPAALPFEAKRWASRLPSQLLVKDFPRHPSSLILFRL